MNFDNILFFVNSVSKCILQEWYHLIEAIFINSYQMNYTTAVLKFIETAFNNFFSFNFYTVFVKSSNGGHLVITKEFFIM